MSTLARAGALVPTFRTAPSTKPSQSYYLNCMKTKKSLLPLIVIFLIIFTSCSLHRQDTTDKSNSALSSESKKTIAPIQIGMASVYSDSLQGKLTASGEAFDQQSLTAASKTHPLGSKLKVTSKKTGKSTTVKVTDRGPHVKGRVIDLSKSAAEKIGMPKDGLAQVQIERIE